MTLFAVTRSAGTAWIEGRTAFEQPDAAAHNNYMHQLAEDGLVLFAGPLAGSEQDRIRVLLVADARTADHLTERFAEDPWERSGMLTTETIEPWNLLVGADRLAAAPFV